MSGRKACEVTGLLSRGTETRKVAIDGYLNTFNSCQEDIINFNTKEKDYLNFINNFNPDFSNEALNELSNEVEEIKNAVSKLKKSAPNKTFSFDNIKSKTATLDKELQEADDETVSIHQAIKGKSHYCTPEYERADKVLAIYKNNGNERNKLKNEINNLKSQASLQLEQTKTLKSQLEEYQKQCLKLNVKAGKIVELRTKANDAQEFLVKSVDGINSINAEKFMATEYKEILNIKQKATSLSEKELVDQFNNLQSQVAKFQSDLQALVFAFETLRDETGVILEETKSLLTQDAFYEPMDYLKNKDKGTVVRLLDFLDTYANGEYVQEINSLTQKATQSFTNEDFKSSQNASNDLRKLIEKATAYANLKQENMLKNTYLAADIRNVMRGLNYAANAKPIDGNPANGFKVTCTVGDEVIDFDKIFVDDDGNVTTSVDHTESTSGTCGSSWKNIQKAFVDNDIPLADVTKNGRSVIFPGRQTGQQTQTNDERSHGRG